MSALGPAARESTSNKPPIASDSASSSALPSSTSPTSINEWTCSCLNVRLSVQSESPEGNSALASDKPWLATLVSDNAIVVQYPSLTSRETLTLEDNQNVVCAKCLNCDTFVYAASKPAPPGPSRSIGFVPSGSSATEASAGPTKAQSPARDPASVSRLERSSSRSNEPLVRPLDRKVWILPGALSPSQASQAAGSEAFSPAFNILVPRRLSTLQAQRAGQGRIDDDEDSNLPEGRREATPTRPSITASRQTSFGSISGSITYTLPAVPQHLVTTPPQSPRVGGPTTPSSSSIASTSAPSASGLLGSTNLLHPLASQLDSVAVEKLKDLRAKAEAEVYDLVRQKRREMEALEKRIKQEAEALLEVTRASKSTKNGLGSGAAASLIGQALKSQQQTSPIVQSGRGATITTGPVAGIRTQGHAGTTPTASSGLSSHFDSQRSIAIGASRRDSLHDLDSDLPPSAFERRPTYATSTTQDTTAPAHGTSGVSGAVASSLGGLSASFAMRGRDLPTQMQDWSEKRRLRERYPQGDHSALPSAANSNVNSAANSIANSEDDFMRAPIRSAEQQRTRESSVNTEDEAEMNQRGRGRQPTARRESDRQEPEQQVPRQLQDAASHTKTSKPSMQQDQQVEEESERGRSGRQSAGAYNMPPAISSSLLSKRPAIVSVDDGRNDDEDTPSVGGRLVSPQSVAEPSAQVTLRPRGPPPSSAEPLKPATRSIVNGSEAENSTDTSQKGESTSSARGAAPGTLRTRKGSEKKVAFAETEDRVDHTVVSDEYDEAEDEQETQHVTRHDAMLHGPSQRLVDESADAVFEIDEEAEGGEDEEEEEDADEEADGGAGEEADKMNFDESGRPLSHGINASLGYRDESGTSPRGRDAPSGSLSDDFRSSSDDDEDAVPPGFGAASFSALAASQSAIHDLASSMALARADDSGFDPASLRIDGRVVVPPQSSHANNREMESESEPFVVGSLRSSSRRLSVQLPSTTSSAISHGAADAGTSRYPSDQTTTTYTGASNVGSSRHQRSSSRNRHGKMSKEDADTEVRLSGLLAPNAPSHRSLWSPKDTKARKSSKHKYQLNAEDDQKWDEWKRKVRAGDPANGSIELDKDEQGDLSGKASASGRSNPMAVAPPTQYIAAGSGIGPRPRRESTMIDPDYAGSIAVLSGFDRNFANATRPSNAAGLSIGKRTWGYGSFKDDTSGFETEPKTSLPYKEKMMVPSLRKAIRRSMFEAEQAKTKLETIPDAEDASTSAGGGAQIAPSQAVGVTGAAQEVRPTEMESSRDSATKGALPGSVITRGFVMPGVGAASTSASVPRKESPAASVPTSGASVSSAAVQGFGTSATESTTAPARKEVAIGNSLPGSGTATPTSIGRRSPRPPYVPPPPPSSTGTVLVSDPRQAPKPLELFKVPADSAFAFNEANEEEETEEGWLKTLKFLHAISRLKTNKRTGWLHHRVPDPESIADHMYRMALLSILCPSEPTVDLGKCVQLSIVHDLAEAEVGDLTPLDGVGKEEKMRREKEAIQYFVHDLLGSSPAGLRIEALWEEYEARETKESKLVKDLDRFELCLQAIEYERAHGIDDLQGFWEGSLPHISHPRIRKWAQLLAKERELLWVERGRGYTQPLEQQDEAEAKATAKS